MGMDGEMMMDGGTGMDPSMDMGTGMEMASGMGMGAAAGVLTPPPTEFDANEVFGPDVAMATMSESMDDASADASGEGGMGMMGMGMMGPPPTMRWVGLTDGAKFRERGFYLSVIINQQRIPDFLVYLCESAWPTKIQRFQMGPNPYRTDLRQNTGMGAMGMGGESSAAAGEAMPGFGNFGSSAIENMAMGMGMGMGMGGFAPAANRYPGGPPQFARTIKDPFNGSLNNPDLVQLDIAGIITFYVSSVAAAETDAEAAVDTPSAPGGEEELLKEAAAEAAAQKTPAAAPTDGSAPAATTTPAAPAAETPATTPPAAPAPAATPPAADATTPPPAEAAPAQPPAAAPPAAAPPTAPGT
jgi:hypothetical protein